MPSKPLEFRSPPLHEVVIGIQFAPVEGYSQIHAGDVWKLYQRQFPRVEEQPALDPYFETFGLPQQPLPAFKMIQGAMHDRFWFMTDDGAELIQFQPDRLLHNWRKTETSDRPYPRFVPMFASFRREVGKLEALFDRRFNSPLNVTQAEVSYINRIASADDKAMPRADEWLRFLRFGTNAPDDYSGSFREIVRDVSGQPIGRLLCEVKSAVTSALQPVIIFTISVRGAPANPSPAAAFDFIKRSRQKIAERFVQFTTPEAHEHWERLS